MYQLALRAQRVFNAPKRILEKIQLLMDNYKKSVDLYQNGAVVDMHNDQVDWT